MPLIHAEDMEIQEKSLSLYKEIVQEVLLYIDIYLLCRLGICVDC